MLIYIIILIAIFGLGMTLKPNLNPKNKKIYVTIIFLILAIMSAVRNSDVGVDTTQYCIAFKKINNMGIERALEETRYESGFIVLCSFLGKIINNHQILLVVTAMFIQATIFKFIYEESDDVILSSLCYVFLNCFAMYMSCMRQAIAIGIILLAYIYFLKKGKLIKYILSVLIASLFHQSALIMLILIAFKNAKFKKEYFSYSIYLSIIFFFTANILFELFTKLFPVYENYAESKFFESNYFGALINSLVAFSFYVIGVIANKFDKRTNEKDETDFFAFVIMLNFIFYVLTIKISIFNRITTYFNIFNIVWIPKLISNIKNDKNRWNVRIIIFICIIFYWAIISIYRPEWYGVIPYKTCFK